MKTTIFWIIRLLISCLIMFILLWLYVFPEEVTTTEMLHKYKNYVVVQKYESWDKCIIRIKNPYQFDLIHKPLEVPSGVYYNYSVGDTIGKKKQTYLNIY